MKTVTDTRARDWVGLVCGEALLATLVIPWGMPGAFWSWNIFRARTMSHELIASLIVAWVVGAISIGLGLGRSGLPRAIGYSLAGLAAFIFVYLAVAAAPLWRALAPLAPRIAWLQTAAVGTLFVFFVLSGVRSRGGATGPVRVLVAVASAGLAVLLTFHCFTLCRSTYAAETLGYPPWITALVRTRMLLDFVAIALAGAGCLLVLADALRPTLGRAAMAVAGRWLVLAGLAVPLVWEVARPAIAGLNQTELLQSLNFLILLVGPAMIAMEGLIALFTVAIVAPPLGQLGQPGGQSAS